jgi:class 3 adenylate cyclase
MEPPRQAGVGPRIQYAQTKDGVSIAYSVMGDGPPFLCLSPVVYSHLQLEWQFTEMRRWYERLAEKRKLIRYDHRGSGLSERDVADFSLDALVSDIEAVADRLGMEMFDLYAAGAGTRTAITYAVRHSEQVSHLILSRGYARARDVPGVDELLERDWELFTETLAHLNLGWSKGELAHRWAELMRASITHEVYKRAHPQFMKHDVTALLPQVRSPTLVLEGPPRLVGEFASGIPDASLVLLEEFSTLEGDLDAALRAIVEFLGEGGEAETESEGLSTEIVHTILFTDVEGSTTLTDRLGDKKARDLLREHERIVREALKAHGGSEVKTMGDGFMASFSSATKALECAITMQRAFAEHNEKADEAIKVRVGMNAGEPIAEEDDLFGTAVNEAARITAAAKGGEILVADVIRQLTKGKDFLFADRGETSLKGFEDPVRLYEVRWRE